MSAQPGLRERKKQRTRETIARVALELFEERGYQATTLAEIADSADISTRTIFAYFPSKEDILFCEFPERKAALTHALAERPGGKDALETVRDFILSSLDQFGKDELHRRRGRLIDSDETLRNHKRGRAAEIEELVAAAIARDLGAGEDDLRPRIVAASLIAGFEALGSTADVATTPENVAAVIDQVMTFLGGGLEALTTTTPRMP